MAIRESLPASSAAFSRIVFRLCTSCGTYNDLTSLCTQANKAHPYYRYGYSLALGVGLAAAAYAWLKDPAKPHTAKDQK